MRLVDITLSGALLQVGCDQHAKSAQDSTRPAQTASSSAPAASIATSTPSEAAGANCDGTGFYPPGHATMEVFVSATVADGQVTTHSLSSSADVKTRNVTPLGLQRDITKESPVDFEVDYDFPSSDADPQPARLKLSAFYPYQRSDPPLLRVTIGDNSWSVQSQRNPTIGPKDSDVYATVPLAGAAQGLYRPGETAFLTVIDPASAQPLAHASFPLPRPREFRAALKLALADLKKHCEAAGNTGGPF